MTDKEETGYTYKKMHVTDTIKDLSKMDLSRVDLDVYPMLPLDIKEAINKLPPELLNKSEDEYLKFFEPNKYDRLLRLSLWNEFRQAAMNERSFLISKVYGEICSKYQFDEYVIKTPKRLGWLLVPPASYEMQMENLLDLGMQRLREVLQLPFYKIQRNKDGTETSVLDTKILNTVTSVAIKMREAIKGTPVARNININADTKSLPNTSEEIDKRIAELKQKLIGNIEEK